MEYLNIVNPASPEDLPRKDYRPAFYLEGDVRDVAAKLGLNPVERKNDLGIYLTIPLIIEGVPMQLLGLLPFVTVEITVASDPADRGAARKLVGKLFDQLGLSLIEIPDLYGS